MRPDRSAALRALTNSLMTGSVSASRQLGAVLADDVTLTFGPEQLGGHDAVLTRLSGDWASTFALRHLVWAEPVVDGDRVSVEGVIRHQAAWAPRGARVQLEFDADDRIAAATIELVNERPGEPESVIPPVARGVINAARIENRPMCIAYVDADGNPAQTFRGSLQVFDDTRLSVWLRNPGGSFATAIAGNPAVSITYQDSPDRHLFITGTAAVVDDPALTKQVFDQIPEVEALHDPAMKGAAMLIEVTGVRGWLNESWVMMRR